MDVSESNVASQGDSSRKNKLSQVLNRSLSMNVDNSANPLTLTPDYTKLPELNTDKDIEDVLCKISELLTSNSVLSSAPELEDSRSIEEILKEAEDIVRDNSSYFEDNGVLKSSHVENCNLDALSDGTECSIELEQEQNKTLFINSIKDNEPLKNENALASQSHTHLEMIDTAVKPPVEINHENKQERPLTLKDLDVPDRPKILNLTPSIVYSQPVMQEKSHLSKISSSVKSSEYSVNHNVLDNVDKQNLLRNNIGNIRVLGQTNEIIQVDRNSLSNGSIKVITEQMCPSIGSEEKLVQLGAFSAVPITKELPSIHSQTSPQSRRTINMDAIRKIYEEKICDLERQIRILTSKVAEMQRSEEKYGEADRTRLALLANEMKSQEELITGYQLENQKLLSEANKAKKVWIEAEQRLCEKVQRLEKELKRANTLNTTEALELREALADAREELTRLEEESILIRNEKKEGDDRRRELMEEVKRLKSESEGYKCEIETLRSREKDRERRAAADASLAAANLQGKLSQANSDLARKQTEVVRLNTEVTRLRGELERARLGSVVAGDHGSSHHTASHHVRQLEVVLDRERENSRRTLAQLDSINKHNLDLSRQVKELETIVKRRTKSGGGIPWGDDSNDISKLRSDLEMKTRKLEQLLACKDKQLSEHQVKLSDLQIKYEKEVNNLQEKVREMNGKRGLNIRSQARTSQQSSSSDTQMMATIRGLKAEIATKDKQLMKITRELDETRRRMSSRNQMNRSGTLNNNRTNSNLGSKVSESSSSGGASTIQSGNSSKNYNPFLFEEDRETILFLRNENTNLHEEVKRLEQDLINLHNKRIHDLSEQESNHSCEAKRTLVREQTARQANSQITHLRGQLYTQQMVITHLKNQIKVLEQKSQDATVLKTERDQLEQSLLEANKKVATLHQLSSPESHDYADLLEKLEWLERRHELREAKLQTIVKELVAKQETSNVCSSASCKDKLYNKNREICYYRAEMNKILDSLAEYKYIK